MIVFRANALALLSFAYNWVGYGYCMADGRPMAAAICASMALIIFFFCMTQTSTPPH